jgi:hypothetical protein
MRFSRSPPQAEANLYELVGFGTWILECRALREAVSDFVNERGEAMDMVDGPTFGVREPPTFIENP